MSSPVSAQEADAADEETTEIIEVKGIRGTIQSSISIKRESTEIVDGISADDIGDLPALSIGEALETLTGASSHREQGGATEISIRGLGPYLGSTVMNGREAANGSGDRSVNFSQFPSELFNKVAIYKTQSAELIEGGVSGQIHLDTIKPLDFGKRRFQFEYKGNWNPDNTDLEDPIRDFGQRITSSFVDQFETERFGDIGISVGYQKNVTTNPEQEARTGSSNRNELGCMQSFTGIW
jgi:TonB-dependent receptor